MRVEALLERRAHLCAARTAVVWQGIRYSYGEIDAAAARIAASLRQHGVQPGQRVGIRLENSVDAIVAIFGVLKGGGVFFVINPHGTEQDRERLLIDSGATALIARDASGAVQIASRRSSAVDATDAADLAALVYTSGSTGEPKGVMLTHGNLTTAATSIAAYLENSRDDVILNVLPLAFTYGLTQVLTAFHVGATLVLERSFTYPAAMLETMEREKVTGLAMVPTIATLLLQHLKGRRLPHLRYMTNAAAALSTARIRQLRAALPHVALYSMYGQSECIRTSYLPPHLIDEYPESVGIAIPGGEAFVVDEHGQRVDPGVVGELVVRGPHVMKGYWNNPEATARALRPTADGSTALYTGDLFRTDASGLLYFVERRDGIIKTRGEKVAPRYVEEVILRLPGVAEAAVYGVPDDVIGEAVAAMVVPAADASLTPESVRRHCLEHLAPYMVPKTVAIRDSIPMTTSGKISRRSLRNTAAGSGEAA